LPRKKKLDSSPIFLTEFLTECNDLLRRIHGLLEHGTCQRIGSSFPNQSIPHEPLVDHKNHLLPGTKPFSRAALATLQIEVQKVVHKLLSQGYIRSSTSPRVSPVVFASEKDGKQRLCVDCRPLNKETVRNYFPIPHTDVLIDKTQGSRVLKP
jgi:hypothetical protein